MKLRHLIPATLAGLGLRLFFIAQFPIISGDSELYQELGHNLFGSHVYGLYWGDSLVSVSNRMPGYPLFLALVEWLLGPGNERLMVVQAGIDVLACLGIAWLAAKLNPHAATLALWLAMLCPFTANYTATPLTETLAIALTTAALLLLVEEHWFAGSLVVGVTTLVRPESPLLLMAAGLAIAWRRLIESRTAAGWRRRREILGRGFLPLARIAVTMAAGLLLVLFPWGYRNWKTTGQFILISNPDAMLPWEHGHSGYGDWTRTWLVSSKDTYNFAFKFEDEAIDPRDLPPRAYDSEEERRRTVALIARYNVNHDTPSPLDWEFAQLAQERAARRPLRQHVLIPLLRAAHYWFTPRIQNLPYSGDWWPLGWAYENDPRDFSVTVAFFFLNIAYVAMGLVGAWRYRGSFPVTLMATFLLVRTVFLTEHGTIEPRYMLVCFPALLAMGAAGFYGKNS
jgi:hypothetical protein